MSTMAMERIRWRYRALRYRYKLERLEIQLLLDHLSPGDTALDIGAHKGAYSWWMAEAVGPGGQVDAFEPQPTLANTLRALVTVTGKRNIHVEQAGMSRTPGTLTLRVPPGGPSPSASFEALPGEETGEQFEVPVMTIDDWMTSRGHSSLGLIKVDVEGHELEVFAGGEQTLTRHHPCLLFECELRHRASDTLDDVFGFLTGLGYRGHIVGNDALIPIEQFDPAEHQRRDGSAPYLNNFWFERGGRA